MTAARNVLISLAMLSAVAAPALAQTTDPHHPAQTGSAASGTGTPAGTTMSRDEDDDEMQGMPMMNMMMQGMMGGRMMGMMGGPMMGMMADHTDGWLAFLKTELKITDAQAPQWDAFANAVRANAKKMKEMHGSMMQEHGRSAALPDRLGLQEKLLAAHLDAVRQLKAAVDPLYAALSDEQKKTADQVIRPMGMMMGMM